MIALIASHSAELSSNLGDGLAGQAVGIAALALITASLAIPSEAFAGGHGGHGWGHGHHRYGHHFGYAHNSCWKWTPHGPINICFRY